MLKGAVGILLADPGIKKISLDSLIVETYDNTSTLSSITSREQINTLKNSGTEEIRVLKASECLNCEPLLIKFILKPKFFENSSKILSVEFFLDSSAIAQLSDTENLYLPLGKDGWYIHYLNQ